MPDDPPLFRLFNEIGIIAQLSANRFERVMPAGMTLAQFTVLNHLERQSRPRTPGELARAFQVAKGTMSSTLHRLEAKGLVRTEPDPDDARSKAVHLTEAGRAMRDACLAALRPSFADLLPQLDVPALTAMIPTLTLLRQTLDTAPDR
jgi:DNA-binding MarR family transcriptional regulator